MKEVAKLHSLARHKITNWRADHSPYPSTVQQLFDIHAIVIAAVIEMGEERVRNWLVGGNRDSKKRLKQLQTPLGRSQLLKEIQGVLFERVEQPVQLTEAEYNELDAEVMAEPRPDLFADEAPI